MAAYRPRLDPSFRPIVRSSGIVQLGATAESGGILLSGLSAGELALLDRLDGSLSETELYAAARAAGIPHRRAGELLAVLRHHGMLLADQAAGSRPGPEGRLAPAPRSDRLVVVDGTGPLAVAVASVLRASRVGRIHAGAWAADAVEADLRLTRSGAPELVVLVAQGAVDPRAGPWPTSRSWPTALACWSDRGSPETPGSRACAACASPWPSRTRIGRRCPEELGPTSATSHWSRWAPGWRGWWPRLDCRVERFRRACPSRSGPHGPTPSTGAGVGTSGVRTTNPPPRLRFGESPFDRPSP